MRDPRVKQCESDDDDQLYPCIRCHAKINATMDMVCEYLSDETKVSEYNDLVIQHKCIEDITPQSKVCQIITYSRFFKLVLILYNIST